MPRGSQKLSFGYDGARAFLQKKSLLKTASRFMDGRSVTVWWPRVLHPDKALKCHLFSARIHSYHTPNKMYTVYVSYKGSRVRGACCIAKGSDQGCIDGEKTGQCVHVSTALAVALRCDYPEDFQQLYGKNQDGRHRPTAIDIYNILNDPNNKNPMSQIRRNRIVHPG